MKITKLLPLPVALGALALTAVTEQESYALFGIDSEVPLNHCSAKG